MEKLNHVLQVVLEASDAFPWAIDIINNELSAFGKKFKLEELKRVVYPDDFHFLGDTIRYLNADHARQEFIPHEVRFNINDTGYHWYKLRGVVDQRDEKGEPIYIIGSAENIEKQKQIESNLIETKEKAIESSNLKTAFLANMSHEIRTPLNAIIGFSGLLAETDNPKEKKEFNEIINQNNTILLQLINDILDLSRIESGSVDLKNEPFSLLTLITDMDKASKSAYLPKKGVKIIFEKSIDETIVGDKNRISQILNNYITNACKFTDKGSIRISYERKDNGICFSVTDTGIGISQNDMDRIFIRFEKLNSFVQGTGLGLAICLSLAEAMNGKVDVESKEGEGSTFRLWIPVKAEFSEKSKIIKK